MTGKRKRKSEVGGAGDVILHPSKSHLRDNNFQGAADEATFERFLATYRGRHDDPLGRDSPPTKLFVQKESQPHTFMTLSHRAAIEIRIWLEDQAQAHQNFNHVRSVVINGEVMAAPLIRIRIPSPGPLAVIKALEIIIPKVSTWFGIVSDVLKTWQSTIHGVECLVIQIEEIYALDSN
ncbi:uncharacterized protein RSE6_14179 [Rhynchosporium secalis]|uniref:Uncharacterized protein n=1 Tax=Rhynchosporium secalis TaxID=38038 RepID=A0A1E1MUQ9_RHYSE|nr:uncharacterized protein RSE6_14179 [Rhynchosporium secalis]